MIKTEELPGWALRLKSLEATLGLSGIKIAASIGLKQSSTWSRWIHAQFGAPPDDVSLNAIEHVHSIRREWILTGEEPMFTPDRESRALLASFDPNVYPMSCPKDIGMAPTLESGDTLLVAKQPAGDLVEDNLYLVTETMVIGRARKTPSGWLLYRDEDRVREGMFPPVPVKPSECRRIAYQIRPIP